MIFEEYYKKYRTYKKIKKEINDLENKKINLMRMVDVQAIPPKDNIGGVGILEDKMLVYTAELEQVELDLDKNKRIINEIKSQLKEVESELRESKEILDNIYLYKYIEKLKWYQICQKIGYEKTKTYDFINEVELILNKIRITEKNGKI